MTGYSPEQMQRLAELAARKAEIDARAERLAERRRESMRARGEPIRSDYPSRAAYRKAVALFRRRTQ